MHRLKGVIVEMKSGGRTTEGGRAVKARKKESEGPSIQTRQKDTTNSHGRGVSQGKEGQGMPVLNLKSKRCKSKKGTVLTGTGKRWGPEQSTSVRELEGRVQKVTLHGHMRGWWKRRRIN